MNLHVLFLGQPHDSCLFVWHFHLMEVSGVCYDGLDAYLVMYILHEFKTGCVSQSGYLALISWRSYVEILHMDSANCVINSGIPFESNIEVLLAQKTQDAIEKAFVIIWSNHRPTLPCD